MNLKQFEIDKDILLEIHNNNLYNRTIIDYYNRYLNCVVKNRKNTIINTIKSIETCNKFFTIDKYTFSLVKDFKRTNLCRSKFCNNCKKVKQASRMSRYIPELKKHSDSLYHITLTVPNIEGEDLKFTLKKMVKAFRNIVLYMNGQRNNKVFDFSKLGYEGAIRSLEITFKDNEYHPHFHCCFKFNNLELDKKFKNKYSFDKFGRKDVRLFSSFEILIQKMWYLFLNGITFNKENFDKLDVGYSCMCDKFKEGDYAEIFKYMTKATDEKHDVLTYDNFLTLLDSTYNFKQIQGYGCFYMINDEDLDDEVNKVYIKIQDLLTTYEKPMCVLETPFDLLHDEHYTLISRKKIFEYIKNGGLELEHLNNYEEIKNTYGVEIIEDE